MIEFNIGSLQLIGSSTSIFALTDQIEGLEMPEVRVSNYEKPGEDGGVVSSVFYGTRGVTVSGIINAPTCEEYESSRQALAAACAYNKDEFGYPTLTRFTFTDTTGDTYFFDGQVTRLTCPRGRFIKSAVFMINIIVPNPQLFLSTLSTSGTIARASGSGFLWPFEWPIVWGTTAGGVGTANNTGTVKTYPIVTLTGAATNPYIYNATADRYIQLNYTTSGADVIVIDMAEKTITLNGSTNLLTTKTTGSEWWWLEPGVNTINFSTGSGSDTATIELTWYNAVLGV